MQLPKIKSEHERLTAAKHLLHLAWLNLAECPTSMTIEEAKLSAEEAHNFTEAQLLNLKLREVA
jgi:hypothetical protein